MRVVTRLVVAVFLCALVTGCGHAAEVERDQLKVEKAELNGKIETIQTQYDRLNRDHQELLRGTGKIQAQTDGLKSDRDRLEREREGFVASVELLFQAVEAREKGNFPRARERLDQVMQKYNEGPLTSYVFEERTRIREAESAQQQWGNRFLAGVKNRWLDVMLAMVSGGVLLRLWDKRKTGVTEPPSKSKKAQ